MLNKIVSAVKDFLKSPTKRYIPGAPRVGVNVAEDVMDVYPVRVRIICQPCQIPMPYVRDAAMPNYYIHKCPKCGREHSSMNKYPFVKYEEF